LAGLLLPLLAGAGCREGALAPVGTKDVPRAPQADAVQFRYAPPKATYHYVSTTVTNEGSSDAHKTEIQFAVKVSKRGQGYEAVATVESVLRDGQPGPGITEAMILAFKLTTNLDADGAIVGSSGTGLDKFVGPGARDIGIAMKLPKQPLRPGETWTEERGSGPDRFKVEFKFVELQQAGATHQAKFEERAMDSHGGRVENPTQITIDADTGVLILKSAQMNIPSGPRPTDPPIPIQSEIRLKG